MAPTAPAGLTATPSASAIGLSWTAASGTVTGYNVYRGTSAGGESATPIATGVTTTSFTDTSSTGLANGYTYYYEVAAVNTAGTGPMSNEANAPYDSLSALTLDGLAAVSGYTGSGTVTLATTAQNAITVSLSSSDPSITVPATAIVPAGSSTATFSYTVGNVGSETSVTMTASTNTSLSQTIDSVPAIKLDAVGTASRKITLYWSGLSSASGYDIYRSTASTGPFVEIASGIDTPDTGPGVTNELMWSDNGAGLPADSAPIDETDYYYYVVAVDSSSGQETFDSDQADAMSGPDAIPWDTGDPTAITNALAEYASYPIPGDIDQNGDINPAQMGMVVGSGPDGVQYQGADIEGNPPAASAATAYYDPATNEIVDASGDLIGPAEPMSDGAVSIGGQNPNVPPPTLDQTLSGYPWPNYCGPFSKVTSQTGYCAISSTQVYAPTPQYDRSFVGLGSSTGSGDNARGVVPHGQDMAYVYMGGGDNTQRPGVANPVQALDAGMYLPSSNPFIDPGYEPFVNPVAKNVPKGATWPQFGTVIKPGEVMLNGQNLPVTKRIVLFPDEPNDPMVMSLSTTARRADELGGLVIVHFHGQCEEVTRAANGAIESADPQQSASVTIFAYVPSWKYTNLQYLTLKKMASIAQDILPPSGGQPGDNVYPSGSYLYGVAWGGWYFDVDNDQEGSLITSTGSFVPWDTSSVWRCGTNPYSGEKGLSSYGDYVYDYEYSPYFMDTVNISSSPNSNLSTEGPFVGMY